MVDYNEYLNKLKEYHAEADFDALQQKIEKRVLRKATGMRLALAGAVAVLLLAVVTYYYYPTNLANNDDSIVSYVFEQEKINGPVISYVFDD